MNSGDGFEEDEVQANILVKVKKPGEGYEENEDIRRWF